MSFPTVERNRSQNATCQITVDSAAGSRWKGLKDRCTGLRILDHRGGFCPNSLSEQLLAKDHYFWENLFEQNAHALINAIKQPTKFYAGLMSSGISGAPIVDVVGKVIGIFNCASPSSDFRWIAASPTSLLKKKVEGFASLKTGWDSYNASPPSKTAIKNTLTLLGVLEMLELSPEWVEPTSDDSIMLEVKVGEIIQEWDFYSDGEVAVLYEKDGEAVECRMVEPKAWELSRHVTLLANHA